MIFFMIWTNAEKYLLNLINRFNKKQRTIKVDFQCSKTEIEFLVVLIQKGYN